MDADRLRRIAALEQTHGVRLDPHVVHAALRRRGRGLVRWIAEVVEPDRRGGRISRLGARRRGARHQAELDLEAAEASRDLERILAEAGGELRSLRAPRPVAPPRETVSLPPPVLPPDAWVPERVAGLDGSGIVIGVVDFGFRTDHAMFRAPDGSSRIAALWDQNARGRGPDLYDTIPGRPFNADYGVVHERAAIEAWTAGTAEPAYDPTQGYHEPALLRAGLHGTHVASLAAGSEITATDAHGAARRLSGVAPAADLYLVQLGVSTFDHLEPPPPAAAPGGEPPPPRCLSDNIKLRDAVHWIVSRAVAERRAGVVVNLSLATHAGAHDGRSMVEAEIDSLIEALDAAGTPMPMIAVVVCAGNAGALDCHAAVPLAPGEEDGFGWRLDPDDETLSEIELWHDPAADIAVTLHAPPPLAALGFGPWVLEPTDGQTGRWLAAPDGGCFGWWSNTRHPRGTRPVCVGVRIDPALDDGWDPGRRLNGVWRFALAQRRGPPATVHAWVERERSGQAGIAAPPVGRRADFARSTLGSLCCGASSIVVGAVRRSGLSPSGFGVWPASGAGFRPWTPGPIAWAEWRDAARPHLCAVGIGVAGAGGLSAHDVLTMDGTSHAAPQVAGAAALIMQEAASRGRRLSAAQLRDALVAAARARPVLDPFRLDPAAAERAGAGLLDPAGAVAAARAM
ncbi:MAG: S8 family serine peptidase [Acetobacteraceae bacterium]